MLFYYSALDGSNHEIHDKVEAATMDGALRLIKDSGLFVIRIRGESEISDSCSSMPKGMSKLQRCFLIVIDFVIFVFCYICLAMLLRHITEPYGHYYASLGILVFTEVYLGWKNVRREIKSSWEKKIDVYGNNDKR